MDEGDELEADVEAAIAACRGDLRATIKALLIANGFLSAELRDQMAAISRGYGRGGREAHGARRASKQSSD